MAKQDGHRSLSSTNDDGRGPAPRLPVRRCGGLSDHPVQRDPSPEDGHGGVFDLTETAEAAAKTASRFRAGVFVEAMAGR